MPLFSNIKDIVAFHDLDILAVGETWLRDSVDSRLISINGLRCVRADRRYGTRGSGAALYLRDLFPHAMIKLPRSSS